MSNNSQLEPSNIILRDKQSSELCNRDSSVRHHHRCTGSRKEARHDYFCGGHVFHIVSNGQQLKPERSKHASLFLLLLYSEKTRLVYFAHMLQFLLLLIALPNALATYGDNPCYAIVPGTNYYSNTKLCQSGAVCYQDPSYPGQCYATPGQACGSADNGIKCWSFVNISSRRM